MDETNLHVVYEAYVACLNSRDWPSLDRYVHDDVVHNGRSIGLHGYREMLERDVREIPDLHFEMLLVVADASFVASRLGFDCTPTGTFLGLPVNGTTVSFTENVFYRFRAGKIDAVWSVIDKAAIERRLSAATGPSSGIDAATRCT